MDATIPKPPVETPYNTVEIVHEYDGYADFPDRPLNLLADLNALAGVVHEHPNKRGVDLSDPSNVVTTSTNSLGGTTTHVLVTNRRASAYATARSVGVPDKIVNRMDRPLRRIINTGYSGERPGAAEPQSEFEGSGTDRTARASNRAAGRVLRGMSHRALKTAHSDAPKGTKARAAGGGLSE
ncbi:hypothetical protein FHU31_002467 [Mycolicibacterium fluoranthenivorans]|uniref:PE-PPE domain-containing protein n=1 Tax=Mycolicibacterium fluoranthenivorans TaxID=258505 RepID=A0A7X5TZ88_9MYCO|nr:hypothetical protein [Mycolicibacterium fluoranthenivorans]